MRATIITLVFLVLNTVLATPIYLTRGDAAASLVKRDKTLHRTPSTSAGKTPPRRGSISGGGGEPKGGKTGQTKARGNTICKRTTSSELVKALRSINGPEIGAGKFGKSYRLELGGQKAVVKVVKTKGNEDIIIQEVATLKIVHQYLAWGRRPAAEGMDGLDYIVMPDMGDHYDKVPGLTKAEAETLMYEARDRYEHDYKLTHGDLHFGNALYQRVGGKIVCHLVDWLWSGAGTFTHPGQPLAIAISDCVFDPWATNSDSEEHSSGSEGYMADRSSPPHQGSSSHMGSSPPHPGSSPHGSNSG